MLDYLVKNAKIADGEGEKKENALGIENSKIAFLGRSDGNLPEAASVIDIHGALLVPGIIDIHCHSDSSPDCAEKLLCQGVTCCLSGNCGLSPQVDFAAFRAAFQETGYPIHQAEQIGHSSLRLAAGVPDFYTAATASQIDVMKALIHDAFAHGAAGLSLGLEYDPGAPFEEALVLAQTAVQAAHTACRPPLVSIHARNVDRHNDDSIEEAIQLAKESGARLIVSHLVYMWNGGGLGRTLDRITAARAAGVDIWADSGMWTAYSTTAGSAVFDEDEFIRKGYDFTKVRAAGGKYAGRFLNIEQYREVRRDSPKDCFIYDPGSPSDIWQAFLPDYVMVSTDAAASLSGGHPQNAGTYPRFFRVMVQGGGLTVHRPAGAESSVGEGGATNDGETVTAYPPYRLSLTEALRRVSLIPADVMGLNKGRIAVGRDADLAVFDMETIGEMSDFPGAGDPNAPPRGILHVFVNGVLCFTEGRRLPGRLAGRMV
ncbi:MAG: amidohydrolase family protein [Spirochaetaceae bacterium]|jgi:N-acyl-D-amino-acid deacylase|nr:amidohydrolase family protein [Spirochaetaceae bacterium]